jgi:hypothetical protein
VKCDVRSKFHRGQRAWGRGQRDEGGKECGEYKNWFFPNSGKDELQNIPFFSFLKSLIFKNLP